VEQAQPVVVAADVKLECLEVRAAPLEGRDQCLQSTVHLLVGGQVRLDESVWVHWEGDGQMTKEGRVARADAVKEPAEEEVGLNLVWRGRRVGRKDELVLRVEDRAGLEVDLAAGQEEGDQALMERNAII